nr:DNA/RNA helicase domain-containing protein [uncultured Rhodopila sp.]
MVLAGQHVLVLEFKDFRDTLPAHVDQVAGYARDLASYQEASHEHDVIPILVNTLSTSGPVEWKSVWITGAAGLADCMERSGARGESWLPVEDWIRSPYAPLPSLVRAARMIFRQEPLPRIRQAKSAGVDEAVEAVAAVIADASCHSGRHVVFITGEPGAGKTLTGLQLIYTLMLGDEADRPAGVFLSGNGPLVAVLQYALKGPAKRGTLDPSRVFVRDVLAFVRDHIGPESVLPPEHVWVYDEAQRAWDADRVGEKHNYQMSEPEMFIRLGERMPAWSVMVGLIGSGQEIFRGEELGMEQWNMALQKMPSDWTVHCPSLDAEGKPLAELFSAAAIVRIDERLSLDKSLRSHLALDLPAWVGSLLTGDIKDATLLATTIRSAGFSLYVTRDIAAAKNYVRTRYEGDDGARYGCWRQIRMCPCRTLVYVTTFPFRKILRNTSGHILSIRRAAVDHVAS